MPAFPPLSELLSQLDERSKARYEALNQAGKDYVARKMAEHKASFQALMYLRVVIRIAQEQATRPDQGE